MHRADPTERLPCPPPALSTFKSSPARLWGSTGSSRTTTRQPFHSHEKCSFHAASNECSAYTAAFGENTCPLNTNEAHYLAWATGTGTALSTDGHSKSSCQQKQDRGFAPTRSSTPQIKIRHHDPQQLPGGLSSSFTPKTSSIGCVIFHVFKKAPANKIRLHRAAGKSGRRVQHKQGTVLRRLSSGHVRIMKSSLTLRWGRATGSFSGRSFRWRSCVQSERRHLLFRS